MTIVEIPYRFRVRGGTAADLATVNEVPLRRELVFELDTLKSKLGDGDTAYNDLPYNTAEGGAPVELQANATHIQWRLLGDLEWIDLVPLSELNGEDGEAGGPSQVSSILGDTTLTLALHANRWLEVSDDAVITLPATDGTDWQVGFFVELCQAGAAPFTVAAGAGSIIAPGSNAFSNESRYRGGVVVAKLIAADTWRVVGALADA